MRFEVRGSRLTSYLLPITPYLSPLTPYLFLRNQTVSSIAPWEIRKDIAAGLAMIGFLFVLPIYIPLFSVLCPMFMPLPILFYRVKLGRKSGAFVPILSVAIMTVMSGGLMPGIIIFAVLMLSGFMLGELFEIENLSLEKTVLYVWITVLLAGWLGLSAYELASGKEIHTFLSDITEIFDEVLRRLKEDREIPAEKILLVSEFLKHAREIFLIIKPVLPGMAASSVLFVIWATLLTARAILKKKGLPCPDFGSLNQWKVPEFLVWGVIGCGFVLLAPADFPNILGYNGLIILMMIYFLGGIAVLSFYFEKKRFPLILKIFLYSLIALQIAAQFLVIALGFFDIWFNFRRLKSET